MTSARPSAWPAGRRRGPAPGCIKSVHRIAYQRLPGLNVPLRFNRANAREYGTYFNRSGTSSTSTICNSISHRSAAAAASEAITASAAQPASSPAAAMPESAAYRDYLRGLRRRALTIQAWQIGWWSSSSYGKWRRARMDQSDAHQLSVGRYGDARRYAAGQQPRLHSWTTFSEIVIGFCGSMTIGLACAVALWSSPFLYRVLDPSSLYSTACLNSTGADLLHLARRPPSIYAMAIAVSVFVTIIMLYTGFNAVDPDKIKLAKLFGASQQQILLKIVLPASVPTMISTLKVNVGLALVGVVVGEFPGRKAGLGCWNTPTEADFPNEPGDDLNRGSAAISSVLFIAIQAVEMIVYTAMVRVPRAASQSLCLRASTKVGIGFAIGLRATQSPKSPAKPKPAGRNSSSCSSFRSWRTAPHRPPDRTFVGRCPGMAGRNGSTLVLVEKNGRPTIFARIGVLRPEPSRRCAGHRGLLCTSRSGVIFCSSSAVRPDMGSALSLKLALEKKNGAG